MLNLKTKKTMELIPVNNPEATQVEDQRKISSDQFIATKNTRNITTDELKRESIIPVFAKDNESTISHPEFIQSVGDIILKCMPSETVLEPAVKVSHPIKGRIPEAKGKPAEELLESEKTIYYERMAFAYQIPSISGSVAGNSLSLTIGGVRAYNHENLYGRKTEEHFKVFIGFQNHVCINLCISTDGFKEELRARALPELMEQVYKLISVFEVDRSLNQMKEFLGYSLTENQFAQLVGKAKMYAYLPRDMKKEIPELQLGDSQVNLVVKDYYKDKSFCRNSDGEIDLWRLYNLFTGASKKNYIDTFLDRTVGAHTFVSHLKNSLENMTDFWYIN